jgi:hypothetical protein
MSAISARSILAAAERLRALNQDILTTVARRHRSAADRAAWERACAVYHAEFDRLCYPGGSQGLDALKQCLPEGIRTAITYLEADPMVFRSGYIKEELWQRLPRCPLSEQQRRTLEKVALSYFDRRIGREFWYMARAMARLGSAEFWETVRQYAHRAEGCVEGRRASFLAAYAEGIPAGERVRRQVRHEALCRSAK